MTLDRREQRRSLLTAWQRTQVRFPLPLIQQASLPSFKQYAWDKFDPETVVSLLASNNQNYYAHKHVLLAGFCAWVVAPHSRYLIRNAIAIAAGTALSVAEKHASEKFEHVPQLGDIYARVVLTPFLGQIYYPIGGIDSLLRATSFRGFKKSLRKASRSINDIVTLLTIFHYHVDLLLEQRRFGKPSLHKGSELVSQMAFGRKDGQKPRGGRRILTFWRDYKRSAAFSYEASRIPFTKETTLLDYLRGGGFYLEETILEEWLGKAKYVNDHILKRSVPNETILRLPGIASVPLQAPDLAAADVTVIENAFLLKRYSRTAPNQ